MVKEDGFPRESKGIGITIAMEENHLLAAIAIVLMHDKIWVGKCGLEILQAFKFIILLTPQYKRDLERLYRST